MESHILNYASDRSTPFRPNEKLDALIEELRALIGPAQQAVNQRYDKPKGPVIAVVGCPRSGTTFLTQLMVKTGAVSYPSNLLARFAYAPYVGALIQQMLLNPELDFRNEFSDLRSGSGFSSDIGKTSGALGISEFFHFWRRFFPNHDPGHVDDEDLDMIKLDELRRELAAIEAAFGKPFMSKAMMLQYNLGFFAHNMPELVIIHVRRDPVFVMQSITQARLKYYGTDRIWWSIKPREYAFLKDEAPATQVAGQVLFTDEAIRRETQRLPPDRYIEARYEDLCESPHAFLCDLADRLRMPALIEHLDQIDRHFPSGNIRRLDDAVLKDLTRRYEMLKAHHLDGDSA